MKIMPIPVFYMVSAKKDSLPSPVSRQGPRVWPLLIGQRPRVYPHIVLNGVDLLESGLTDVIVPVCRIYCVCYLQGLGTMYVEV